MIVFGAVQYNDADYLIWMPIYFAAAALPILYLMRKLWKPIPLVLMVVGVFFLLSYAPAFLEWVSGGMPNIAESMKAESPYIELIREFFGLLICVLVAMRYYILARRKY